MTSDHDPARPGPHLPALSRRGFLGTAALGGAAAMGMAWPASVPAQPGGGSGGSGGSGGGTSQGTRVRSNIYALAQTAEGRATIEAYRTGVKAMMAKPYSDVTSWRFQAAIHLPYPADARDFAALPVELQLYLDRTNLCQHRNLRFLPWHRMYVYFFERIVRKASGKADFMLPYWNYTDSSAERALPEAFRNPATEAANALFRSARAPGINSGTALDSGSVSTSGAFNETSAAPSGARPGFYQEIESQPHNIIHVTLGGDGLMSDPATAALDPIFWLHHCNIDRLWSRWNARGRTNVSDGAFLGRVHRFWDEDGNLVEMTTREVMDTVTRLDYRYDDATAPEAGTVTLAQADSGVEAGAPVSELAASAGPVTLSREGVTIQTQPVVEAGGPDLFATATPDQLSQPVVLRLDDIRFDTPPRTVFEVYLNAPEGAARDRDPAYFVGLFAPFTPPEGGDTYDEAFDVSGLIDRQIRAGIYDGGAIDVRIVPRAPLEARGVEAGGVEAGALPEITVGRVSLIR